MYWALIAEWEGYIFIHVGLPLNLISIIISFSKKRSKLLEVMVYLSVLINILTVPNLMYSWVDAGDGNREERPVLEIIVSSFILLLSLFYLLRLHKKMKQV